MPRTGALRKGNQMARKAFVGEQTFGGCRGSAVTWQIRGESQASRQELFLFLPSFPASCTDMKSAGFLNSFLQQKANAHHILALQRGRRASVDVISAKARAARSWLSEPLFPSSTWVRELAFPGDLVLVKGMVVTVLGTLSSDQVQHGQCEQLLPASPGMPEAWSNPCVRPKLPPWPVQPSASTAAGFAGSISRTTPRELSACTETQAARKKAV